MTITDDQIEALRAAAAAAGDTAQRILCDLALDAADQLELAGLRRVLRMTRHEARAECARVLAEVGD